MSVSSRRKASSEQAMCSLVGIGPKSAAMLLSVGIKSVGELRRVGAVAAFVQVRRAGLGASLNLLWALEGALTKTPWTTVARTERTRLLLELDDMARGHHADPRHTSHQR